MAQFTLTLPNLSTTLYFQYYTKVQNTKQLLLNTSNFECAFINPTLLVSITQVLQAANRALFQSSQNRSKTSSIYSDILYYLSPSENITEALSHYSPSESTTSLLIATFNVESLSTLKSAIEGELRPIVHLSECINFKEILKLFQILPSQLSSSYLSAAVYSVLSIKDLESSIN